MSIKMMLAHNYVDQEIIGWHMSEKLDGIRAYWDGERFYSRTGKNITAPKAFLDRMPRDITLDGELYAGRGNFNITSSIVRKTKNIEKYTDDWLDNITYCVFDTPEKSEWPFERRLAYMYEKVGTKYKNVEIVRHTIVKKEKQMYDELERVTKLDGEGLMLRKYESTYEHKRSKNLLKVKKFHDMEVKIIGYKNGTGKYKGKVGSFECVTKEGNIFNCGSGLTDVERSKPPKIGTFITVKYFELSKDGIPRFPIFMRIAERQEF